MTALSQDRKTDKLGTEDVVLPGLLKYPVEANTSIYGGAIVCVNANGNAVPASAIGALKAVGRAERQCLNIASGGTTSPDGIATGAAGSIKVPVRQGVFYLNVNADTTVTTASFGANVFASDDNTVSTSDAGGTRPYVGYIVDPAGDMAPTPLSTQVGVMVGMPNPYQLNPLLSAAGGGSQVLKARNVVTSLTAYTGSGTQTITASANGAFGAQDGVTNVVNDIVFIQAGTANLTGAVDSGPWMISSLGGASAKWVLTRPDWWTNGMTWAAGARIEVGGEGAFFANTSWKATSGAGIVGTNDPGFYVGRVTFQVTLASGVKALTAGTGGIVANNCPCGILSASRSQCEVSLNTLGGTNTGTVSFGSKALTPGYVGTSAFSVFAFAANMATQTSDASVLNVTIDNGF